MKVIPLNDNVLVTRSKAESVTPGGIYVPQTAQEKTAEGVVMAVGPGLPFENGKVRRLGVKVGDKVLFDKHSGTDVKIGGEELTVLREHHIICILA